jgi:hypothetical protein
MHHRRLRCPVRFSPHDGSVQHIRDTSRQHSFPGGQSEYVHQLACSQSPPREPTSSCPTSLATNLCAIGAMASDRIAVRLEAARASARHARRRGTKDRVTEKSETRQSRIIVRVADRRGHSRRRKDRTRTGTTNLAEGRATTSDQDRVRIPSPLIGMHTTSKASLPPLDFDLHTWLAPLPALLALAIKS